MDDLISRRAAINAMARWDWQDLYLPIHFKQLLDELPSVTPDWIPCNDRLPEAYGEYLITWTTSQSKRPFIAICEGEITGEYDHENNRFKFEWLLDDYIKAYPDVEVIAWMPLPEPWGGE